MVVYCPVDRDRLFNVPDLLVERVGVHRLDDARDDEAATVWPLLDIGDKVGGDKASPGCGSVVKGDAEKFHNVGFVARLKIGRSVEFWWSGHLRDTQRGTSGETGNVGAGTKGFVWRGAVPNSYPSSSSPMMESMKSNSEGLAISKS